MSLAGAYARVMVREHSLMEDEALRLRLKFDAWQVADLPWELAYVARPAAWAGRGEDGLLALEGV